MRHHIGAALLLAGLAACAMPGDRGAGVAQNPYHACEQQGHAHGTAAFGECLERTIAERCAGAGAPAGSPGFAACARRFDDVVLVTRHLDLRGYRLFGEVN